MGKLISTLELGKHGIHVTILQILLLLLIFALCYLVIKYLTDYRIVREALSKVYSRLSEIEKLRIQSSKERELVYGDIEQKGISNKLDRLITYSGIQYKLKFVNTEVVLVFWIVATSLSIIIAELAADNIMLGVVIAVIIDMTVYMILISMANRQYKQIHNSVVKFVNLIENFSATNNDLISIFERACIYIENPLRRHIYDCVITARTSGDKDYALRKLQDSIQNDYFKELIRTLRISSSFESNYSEIIRDGKEALQNNLKYETEKQSIRKTGRIEMLTLGLVGIMCVFMSTSISNMSLMELFFGTGIVGNILAGYIVVCALVVIYIGFIKGMQK